MNGIKDCYTKYARIAKTSKADAKVAFDTAISVIKECIVEGGVSIRGVLTLKRVRHNERNGYNPATKKVQSYPAYTSVTCHLGKDFKEELNGD